MGGNIAWTIRREDGDEYRMSRWTNIFPDVITDEFLSGDSDAFDEALAQWFELKKDWATNGPTGPFKHSMTPAYAPYPYGLRPDEYGIILVDFVTKTLISCNHYTSFDHIFVSSSWWSPRIFGYAERIKKHEQLYALGRITSVRRWDSQARALLQEPLPEAKSFRELVELTGRGDDGWVQLNIDPPPGWTFTDITSDTIEGRQATLATILALGFQLSEDEKQDWQKWIDRLNPDIEEDEE